MKKHVITAVLAAIITLFTAYVLLDTFVIVREYQDEVRENTDETVIDKGNFEPVITDMSYQDKNISIVIEHLYYKETNVYVADIMLSGPELLKTAFAKGKFGENIRALTSDTAANVGAILAINGDYYGARDEGFVVRNGVIYRDTPTDREALIIYQDGSLDFVKEKETTAKELVEQGAKHVLCFGPGIIRDGKKSIDPVYEEGKVITKNPRTAIGIISQNHYVFVVTDGRTDESEGLTVHELADFMLTLGVKVGYNNDGGGSSTLYFNGRVVNDPGQNSKKPDERRVSDIVYIGYN